MKKLIIIIITIFAAILTSQQAYTAVPPGMVQITSEHLHIYTKAPKTDVPFIVTNPQGKRVGFDPRTNLPVAEFPAMYEPGLYKSNVSEEYQTEAFINLVPGEYTIEVIGKSDDIGKLYGEVNSNKKSVDFEYEVSARPGKVTVYKVIYIGPDAVEPGKVIKYATTEILKEDVFSKRYVIRQEGVYKSLLMKAEAIEASVARGNKTAAANQLDAFINEVKAQTDEHFEEEGKFGVQILKEPIFKSININTSKNLIEDAQYIKDHL